MLLHLVASRNPQRHSCGTHALYPSAVSSKVLRLAFAGAKLLECSVLFCVLDVE